MSLRYAIAEWFGETFGDMPPKRRQLLAKHALRPTKQVPYCPFQQGKTRCKKSGGVCSIQLYKRLGDSFTADRLGAQAGPIVITCPQRFSHDNLIPKWLGEVVGFKRVYLAKEVPFMRSPITGRAAGKIDMVLAGDGEAGNWFGLEIQAVYFSGRGMESDFVTTRTSFMEQIFSTRCQRIEQLQ